MAALIPFLLGNWKWLLPLVLFAGLAVDDGYHRIALGNCHAARAADRVAAEKAKAEAVQHAQDTSDAIITAQAQALAETAAKVGGITERIIHVPVTTACAQSPAMRAASNGMRELLNAGGGQAPAGRDVAPPVSRPGAGGKP